MDRAWWKESVVYQIYPRSFMDSDGDGIGDINGITQKLDYLKELGIDVIWLSPVYESPNDDNGYDISDYGRIMKEFGTMEDFDRMLSEAHKRGIRIVMDLVVNHTSDEHAWFVESRSSVDNPFRNYYIWREGKDGREPNNWGSCFGGSAWEFDKKTDMYYLHLFSKKQPDLNWDNECVREEVFQMMDWWCKKGIDGFRMDVISMISKEHDLPDGETGSTGYGDYGPYVQNGPHVHEYLKEMNRKVLSKYNLMTVGECAGVTVEEAKKYANLDGTELDMVFQFEHMGLDSENGSKWCKKRMDLVELKAILSKWQTELHGKAWNSLYWCNHDQPRIVSRLGDNGKYREASAKMLATCLHFMQGTPYIYQGEELGMTNVPFASIEDFRDIESIHAYEEYTDKHLCSDEEMLEYLCQKSRDNARTPVQWDNTLHAGFTSGNPWIMVNPNYKKINAKEQLEREDSVFHYYQKLIRLRKENKIIIEGTYQLLLPTHPSVFAYMRSYQNQRLLVVCNFSEKAVDYPLVLEGQEKSRCLISNYGEEKPWEKAKLLPYEAFACLFEEHEEREKETKVTEEKRTESMVEEKIYRERFDKFFDELKWLYTEVYENSSMFAELCTEMERFYRERNSELKSRDCERELQPDWYKKNDLLGMMFYIDNFAGDMNGVRDKLEYLERCNVNYIHLMPFLDTPKGSSDGGYAVADFRKVQPELGTMEDLEDLTAACHKKNMNVCMDFVMNHTSDQHEWARRARGGEGEYMSRYFFFDNDEIPKQYERTVPQVFPTTAPGNFTWLDDIKHYVMTSFYPYQWDLNYANPRVFNEMIYNFLYLANKGIDVIRIDAVPYIWKELGTSCRNLPRVHTIVRMMRMISEIVCPGILLLGEVVMEPEKVTPYFGTLDKPECHMLYNVTTMATTWHTIATRNVSLLKRQLDIVNSLPKQYVFLNYLRCHDDIGWGLDYPTLQMNGMEERSHKQYLNEYFLGLAGYSNSRGELYNADPVTGDARFCGTTASMCGIEAAEERGDETALALAIQQDLMLHAYMFMQSGIPVLYGGDEIAQLNDYSYKEDPDKREDSRYIHRGKMNWRAIENIQVPKTVEARIFTGLEQLERLRKTENVFFTTADCWTIDTYTDNILCIVREYEGERILGLFNFSEYEQTAWIKEEGMYRDLLTQEQRQAQNVVVPAYGYFYLKREKEE